MLPLNKHWLYPKWQNSVRMIFETLYWNTAIPYTSGGKIGFSVQEVGKDFD